MDDYYHHHHNYESDLQTGLGRRGYGGISHVYIGTPNQRGHGIGSFLGGLFRRALPFIRVGAKAIGKEALRAGVKVAGDVLKRDIPIRDAIGMRARESSGNLKRKAAEKIDNLMHGSGYKMGRSSRVGHSIVERLGSSVSVKRRKRSTSKRKKKKKTIKRTIKKKRSTAATRRNIKKRLTASGRKKKARRTVADIFG